MTHAPELFVKLFRYFEDDCDILNVAFACKGGYRALRYKEVQDRLCQPYKETKLLTYEQYEVLDRMKKENMCAKQPCIQHIVGEVGSGKTRIGLRRAWNIYKDMDENSRIIMIVCQIGLIQQWVDVLELTNLEWKVRHKIASQCWQDEDGNFPRYVTFSHDNAITLQISDVVICSETNHLWAFTDLNKYIKNIVCLRDEAHSGTCVINKIFNFIKEGQSSKAFAYIGLTASKHTLSNNNVYRNMSLPLNIYEIKNESVLKEELQQVEYHFELVGHRKIERLKKFLPKFEREQTKFLLTDMKKLLIYTSYGAMPNFTSIAYIQVKNKRGIPVTRWISFDAEYEMNLEGTLFDWISPKIRRIGEIMLANKATGDKSLCIDVNTKYLGMLGCYLQSLGLSVHFMTSQLDLFHRKQDFENFKKSGDVLLGSLKLVSEGLNIQCANHVFFLQFPRNPDQYKQAIGRCQRYGQTKKVHVWLISSCEAEEYIAKTCCIDGMCVRAITRNGALHKALVKI